MPRSIRGLDETNKDEQGVSLYIHLETSNDIAGIATGWAWLRRHVLQMVWAPIVGGLEEDASESMVYLYNMLSHLGNHGWMA